MEVPSVGVHAPPAVAAPGTPRFEHHPGCHIPGCFCALWEGTVYNPSGPMYPRRYITKFAEDEVASYGSKLAAARTAQREATAAASTASAPSNGKSKRRRTAEVEDIVEVEEDDTTSVYARDRARMVRDLIECVLEVVPDEVLAAIPSNTFRVDVDAALADGEPIVRLKDRVDFRPYPGLRDYLLHRHRAGLMQDGNVEAEAVLRMLEAGTVTGKLTVGHITDKAHPLCVLNVDSAAGAFATVPLRSGEPLGVYPGVLTQYAHLGTWMSGLEAEEKAKVWSYDIEAPINGYSFHGAGVRNVL